ncbi:MULTISPECIES: GNAT family N-acetyltransferase [Bacteria]|uniref:GNAT family N-acetyltransferase n=1 Tax=Bacteria TaxID=2 RepID=UPI003C7BF64A
MRVRRIRADEADRVRDLRLRALADPVAEIAFLDTLENATAQPEDFWQARARRAAAGDEAAQFVAVAEDDEWFGTATVLVTDERRALRTALVVGVYVAEGHRGEGTVDALLDACAAWATDRGFAELVLEVHVDNARASAAYERCGFVRTGEITELANGHEHVMTRPLHPVVG